MTVSYTGKNKIAQTSSSALPFAPVEYTSQYHNLLNNILRLYFAQVDNVTAALLSSGGGGYLEFPHIAASDTTDQYTTNNTPTVVAWNTLDSGIGFTLNLDGSATATKPGIYKIDYSLQVSNTASQIHEAFVWLAVKPSGGSSFIDLAGSASRFSVPEKHGGVDGFLVAYSSVTFQLNGGDSVQLLWAADVARVISPAADGVYLHASPAQTSPFAMPSTPSAVGTIAFVSNLPA